MQRSEIVGSVIIMAFGGFAITQAVGLEYWSERFGAGPGFIPLWAAVIMVAGGLIQLTQALLKGRSERKKVNPEARGRLIRVAIVAGMTVLVAAMMDFVGFSLPTLVFVLLMVGWIGRHKKTTTIIYSLCMTAAFYLVFVVALSVPLPKGLLGF